MCRLKSSSLILGAVQTKLALLLKHQMEPSSIKEAQVPHILQQQFLRLFAHQVVVLQALMWPII